MRLIKMGLPPNAPTLSLVLTLPLPLALALALALTLGQGQELVLGSKMESNDVAKAATNEVWRIFFIPINMAGMAKLACCKG